MRGEKGWREGDAGKKMKVREAVGVQQRTLRREQHVSQSEGTPVQG